MLGSTTFPPPAGTQQSRPMSSNPQPSAEEKQMEKAERVFERGAVMLMQEAGLGSKLQVPTQRPENEGYPQKHVPGEF